MQYKICPACRTNNEADALFCGSCGASLGQVAAAVNAPPMPGSSPFIPGPGSGPFITGPASGSLAPETVRAMNAAINAGMTLPHGVAPASFGIRLGAYLIDTVLVSLVGFVLLGITTSWHAVYPVWVLYYLVLWGTASRTLGQMMLGLRVVTASGEKLGFGRAALRLLGYAISGLTLGIGWLAIAFDDAKRGLHDRIAKTVVVRSIG